MKKLICSLMFRIAMFITGYAVALSASRALYRGIERRLSWRLGSFLDMDLRISLPLFVVSMALLCLSVWKSEAGKRRFWREADFSLLAFYAFGVLFLSVYYAWYRPNLESFLMLSAVFYTVAAALICETIVRLRDNTLVGSLLWLRFFRLYPPGRALGLIMLGLLAKEMIFVFIVSPFDALARQLNIPLFLMSVGTVAVLSRVCVYVLSLSAEYEKANAEKIRSERFKSELITNVSHDIRTPLTSIIGYIGIIKSMPLQDSDLIGYISVLDKKAARLKTLIDDLMEASRAGSGSLPVNLRELDLTEIVGQIAGEFEDMFAERGLTLVLRLPEERVPVRADSAHLWRVLENLFGNAVKYAMPETRVFAEISSLDGRVSFFLKNISQKPIDLSADELTEQFIRGDRARQTDGNGLGLYIARSLAELMDVTFTIRVSGDLFEAGMFFRRVSKNSNSVESQDLRALPQNPANF